jgi:hypothetical protein
MISIVKLGSNETKRFIEDTHDDCENLIILKLSKNFLSSMCKIFTTSKIFTQHEKNFFQKKIRNEKKK